MADEPRPAHVDHLTPLIRLRVERTAGIAGMLLTRQTRSAPDSDLWLETPDAWARTETYPERDYHVVLSGTAEGARLLVLYITRVAQGDRELLQLARLIDTARRRTEFGEFGEFDLALLRHNG